MAMVSASFASASMGCREAGGREGDGLTVALRESGQHGLKWLRIRKPFGIDLMLFRNVRAWILIRTC